MTPDQQTAVTWLVGALGVLLLLLRIALLLRRADRDVVRPRTPRPYRPAPQPRLSRIERAARLLEPTDMDAAIRLLTERHYAQPVNDTDIPRPRSTGEDTL